MVSFSRITIICTHIFNLVWWCLIWSSFGRIIIIIIVHLLNCQSSGYFGTLCTNLSYMFIVVFGGAGVHFFCNHTQLRVSNSFLLFVKGFLAYCTKWNHQGVYDIRAERCLVQVLREGMEGALALVQLPQFQPTTPLKKQILLVFLNAPFALIMLCLLFIKYVFYYNL